MSMYLKFVWKCIYEIIKATNGRGPNNDTMLNYQCIGLIGLVITVVILNVIDRVVLCKMSIKILLANCIRTLLIILSLFLYSLVVYFGFNDAIINDLS